MTISEKSAYLKGLMDGLSLSKESDEGKMIAGIVDLLGDMAKRISDIEETTIAISDELDEIEEDLDAIEDFIMKIGMTKTSTTMTGTTRKKMRSSKKALTLVMRIPSFTKCSVLAGKSSTLTRTPWKPVP